MDEAIVLEPEVHRLEKTDEIEVQNRTANEIYRNYRRQGGSLGFKDFINREKKKGTFPLNLRLNDEVQQSLTEYQNHQIKTTKPMDKKILGLPVKTVVIGAGIVILAVVAVKFMKKK